MKKKFTFLMAALMLLMLITLPGMVKGQQTVTWTRVTSLQQLTSGGTFIIGYVRFNYWYNSSNEN